MSWLDVVKTYRHITPAQLRAVMPRCREPTGWARAFDDAIEFFGVEDVAMLLAQVGHESADLTRLEENLNYSAERLIAVWPNRFPAYAIASQYAGNPSALANNVYGDRLGNVEPGDGWKYRGRGPLQLTGRDNYQRFATAIDDDSPVKTPSLLTEPTLGALSACWYFATRVTPHTDVETATRDINGGYHGLAERKQRYERAVAAMARTEM